MKIINEIGGEKFFNRFCFPYVRTNTNANEFKRFITITTLHVNLMKIKQCLLFSVQSNKPRVPLKKLFSLKEYCTFSIFTNNKKN